MAAKPQPLEAGQPAPDFNAVTFSGETVSLADYRGRRVALYFYPRDNTPGCTRQACNLRDNWETLAERGVAVIGVSPDSDARHEKFAGKHDLPFPLVADPDREIIGAYGVWGSRMNYGRAFMGLQRTTFLIGPDGVIEHVFKRPKVGDHATEILSKL